jgi:hypothetical protein
MGINDLMRGMSLLMGDIIAHRLGSTVGNTLCNAEGKRLRRRNFKSDTGRYRSVWRRGFAISLLTTSGMDDGAARKLAARFLSFLRGRIKRRELPVSQEVGEALFLVHERKRTERLRAKQRRYEARLRAAGRAKKRKRGERRINNKDLRKDPLWHVRELERRRELREEKGLPTRGRNPLLAVKFSDPERYRELLKMRRIIRRRSRARAFKDRNPDAHARLLERKRERRRRNRMGAPPKKKG